MFRQRLQTIAQRRSLFNPGGSGVDRQPAWHYAPPTGGQPRTRHRSCPEFTIETDSGKRIIVLMNHLKSKGYASPGGETPGQRRERQAKRVATIYRSLRSGSSDARRRL